MIASYSILMAAALAIMLEINRRQFKLMRELGKLQTPPRIIQYSTGGIMVRYHDGSQEYISSRQCE